LSICNICNCSLDYELQPKLTDEEVIKFRESLDCKNCCAISRDRVLMWVLANCIEKKDSLSDLSENKTIRIIESTATRGHPQILAEKFHYLNVEYNQTMKKEDEDPEKFADFQNLHFDDNYFDYVLASDVFEHVRLDDNAFSEIFRTLKPDGYFLMTVPFSYESEDSIIKVKPVGNTDVFLAPPEYHAANTLVYRIYGRDIFKKLTKFGFNVYYFQVQVSQYAISKQEFFLCRKNSKPDTDLLNTKDLLIFRKEEYS